MSRTKPKRSSPKLAVVFSDTHCGSAVGLAHPASEQASGNIVGFGKNYHQQWLWMQWLAFIAEVRQIAGDDPAALIGNGDLTEGIHHGTKEVIAAAIEEHAHIAVQCIQPLVGACNGGPIYFTQGTECHTHGIEDLVAERLGAETGKAKDKWLIEINGCLIDVAHHMPVSSRAYLEAGAMSITMGNARQNYLRCGHRVPSVFLRGHRHCHGYFSDGHGLLGVTGAWQRLTRHARKVVTDSIPRPSMLVLDWRGKKPGALPAVHELVATPPQPSVTRA